MQDQQLNRSAVSTDEGARAARSPGVSRLAPGSSRYQPGGATGLDWTLIAGFFIASLWACTVGDAGALTLTNGGADITPDGAKSIAESVLNILVNYIAPLGGLGMLAGAGASFARNRQSGITAGPAAMGIGGTAMIFSPTLTSQLMTASSAGATLLPSADPGMLSLSVSPVFLASYVIARFLRRR
jgi:hypothetical protein